MPAPAPTAAPSPADPRTDLYGCTHAEIAGLLAVRGLSTVHAARIWNQLYIDLAPSTSAMTGLPRRVQDFLGEHTRVGALPPALETASSDGFTQKYLLDVGAGDRVETVLMRFNGRVTACVSSQVGCAMGCVFCATGQMGFTRNLCAGEIVAQAVHVCRALRAADPSRRIGALRNMVLMGMGEPLLNYDAVLRAVDILRDPAGIGLGSTHITLSTVGIVPGIVRLADERRPIHLAVSLHAATQEGRAALVPLARRWPLDALMEACRHYSRTLSRRILFEWALIAGRTDGPGEAHAVGALLRGLDAQVNLIPLNPTAGYDGRPAAAPEARRFQDILAGHGIPATVRQRRGIDIAAGCGQLAGAASGAAPSTAP